MSASDMKEGSEKSVLVPQFLKGQTFSIQHWLLIPYSPTVSSIGA